MSNTHNYEKLLAGHSSIEAVIHMSRDGLPLTSRTHADIPVDEIVSIVVGLYAAAEDARLLGGDTGGWLFIGAGHGSLYCRAVDAHTLLLLLTNNQSTEQQLERIFEDWSSQPIT